MKFFSCGLEGKQENWREAYEQTVIQRGRGMEKREPAGVQEDQRLETVEQAAWGKPQGWDGQRSVKNSLMTSYKFFAWL